MADLNEKQKRFVDEYLVDLNATAAALRAGYSPASAHQIGHALLKKVEITTALKSAMDKRAARTELTADRVLLEIKRVALFDPRKLFNTDGSPKGIEELDDDAAAAVVGLDVADMFEGAGESREKVGVLKKYRLAPKVQALELAAKHLGLIGGQPGEDERDDPLGKMNATERAIVRDAARRVLESRDRERGSGGQPGQAKPLPTLQ